MELVGTLILLIAIGVLGWHHNKRIREFETRLLLYTNILDGLKTYMDIFDQQELQDWVKTRERTIEDENQVEIEKMTSWMAGLMQERFEAGHWKEREITAATDLIIRLLFCAPPHIRTKAVNSMPNSMYKDAVRKVLDRMPECGHFLPTGPAGSSPPE